VGPRTILDAVVKRKISSPRREWNSRIPIIQPIAQRSTDWAIPTLKTRVLGQESSGVSVTLSATNPARTVLSLIHETSRRSTYPAVAHPVAEDRISTYARIPRTYKSVYPKVSGLDAWSQNCKWYTSLSLGAFYCYIVSQSSEFCRHNPLCCFSTSVYCCKLIFRYRLSPETFGYTYEGISESFRTGRLERELQMVQLSATRCTFIAILWVSLVSFAAITLCVASQRVFVVFISLSTQSGNFWLYPRTLSPL
jgi:hypothetical protein